MKQAQTGWTFHALLNALGPLVRDVDGQTGAELGEISTDSRTITSGSVFVALKGPNFDGHDYAVAAKDRGSGVLIVERNVGTGASCPQIIVTDTVEAYGALARAWRAQFSIPLICVVGSNGKTTTAQMIASILRQACGEEAMLATEGNFNNAVGVPRMLLKLTPRTKAAVIEAGISHPGEMAQLISWIRPTVVVITNAQREHQEFLKGVEASARENAMALVSLSAKGTAVLPADDACLPVWLEFARARGCKVATYAAGDTDFAVDLRATEAMGTVTMAFGSETLRLELKMAGRHAVHDAAAAAAAAVAVGVNSLAVEAGLRSFEPVEGRGRRHVLRNGTVIIDDAYNANPDSMRAAVDMLSRLSGPRIFVAGDMAETGGENVESYHREIGQYAREHGVDRFLAVGEAMKSAVEAFGAGARHFASRDELTAAAMETAKTPCTMLVKASNSMGLQHVVRDIVSELGITDK